MVRTKVVTTGRARLGGRLDKVGHDLHDVPRLLPASFDVDDQGVLVPDDYEVGFACQRR